MLSSRGHRVGGGIHFFDLNMTANYDPRVAYGQSKTANIYMANEIERRYGPKGLHALSIQPGGVITGLLKVDEKALEELKKDWSIMKFIKSPEQGAATTVWAAVGKEWEGRGGRYLENCGEAEPAVEGTPAEDWTIPGYSGFIYNPEKEAKLWKVSLEMVGLAKE